LGSPLRRDAGSEALEDLGRGSSQDVRVLEALAEQAKFAVNQSGATMSTTPAAASTLTQQV
jgi:hypothetical protein